MGTDGYPFKELGDYYCIGGGQDRDFKATDIEIYGAKTKDNSNP